MQNKNKENMVVWVIIVLLVIGFFVYMTINRKNSSNNVANTISGTDTTSVQGTQKEGVKIVVLKEGSGDVVKSGDTVAMNYTGRLVDGTIFDSNVDPKFSYKDSSGKEQHYLVPLIFTIDSGMVIKGWDIGVTGMKVGEKRTLTIEPAFAYGESGAGGVIPPNATLVFDVELLGIKK